MTTRRGFLGAMLAACAAPAIVRADSLMRVIPRETEILLPEAQPIIRPGAEIGIARVTGGGLMAGDLFTIAGDSQVFRVIKVMGGAVEISAPDFPPSLFLGRAQ